MKKGNADNLEGKRGKKGGTQFPRYSLEHLLPHLKNLASKTHTNAININQLNAGVFGLGAKSPTGKIKSSALKQFGLIAGDYSKLKGTELTSQITNSDGEERIKHLQKAFKNVSVFVNAMHTFQNSKTDRVKIGQYAVSTLKIHPDMKDDFVTILIESANAAGLCTIEGNSVSFYTLSTPDTDKDENEPADIDDDNTDSENSSDTQQSENPTQTDLSSSNRKSGKVSNINVNIDVDPSMDPEKLEKLLKLLKNYGAI